MHSVKLEFEFLRRERQRCFADSEEEKDAVRDYSLPFDPDFITLLARSGQQVKSVLAEAMVVSIADVTTQKKEIFMDKESSGSETWRK